MCNMPCNLWMSLLVHIPAQITVTVFTKAYKNCYFTWNKILCLPYSVLDLRRMVNKVWLPKKQKKLHRLHSFLKWPKTDWFDWLAIGQRNECNYKVNLLQLTKILIYVHGFSIFLSWMMTFDKAVWELRIDKFFFDRKYSIQRKFYHSLYIYLKHVRTYLT